MTYDRQVNSTFEQSHADLRDKVGGMTNWSIENDQLATGHIALSTAANGWYIVIESNNLGDGSNASEPHALKFVDQYTDASNYNTVKQARAYTQNGSPKSPTDSVQYWLQYSDSYGFVFYLRRNEGDSKDFAFYFGAMEYAGGAGTEYWDPRTASSFTGTMPPYAYIYNADGNYDGFTSGDMSGNTGPGNLSVKETGTHGELHGMLNPDANFSNYVWYTNAVLYPSDIKDTDTGDNPVHARITDPIWLQDRSGSDVNTGDVIQNSSGGDEWEIVDYHDLRLGIRMF